MNKKQSGRIGENWLKRQATNRKCFTIGCNSKTRKNHLLQKNGILSCISNNREVYKLSASRFRSTFYSIEKKGLNDAFVFRGYCSRCDDNLFKEIEKRDNKEPLNEKDFCLYSLRPVLNEIIKKKNNQLWWEETPELIAPDILKQKSYNNDSMITTLSELMKILNQVVSDEKEGEFVFVTRKIKKIDVCICSVRVVPFFYTGKTLLDIKDLIFNIFICFPMGDETIVISGCHKDSPKISHRFNHRIKECNETELKNKISGTMIHQVEDWCVSEKIYNNIKGLESVINKSKLNQFENFYFKRAVNIFF